MSTVKSHVEGTTLIAERLFKAPRQLVFEAFSTPAHLEKWWGPSGWETKVYSFDFKPGGIWHYCMTCVDKEQGDFYMVWNHGANRPLSRLSPIHESFIQMRSQMRTDTSTRTYLS
ncbi:SRPBCC family protein [Exiguobacterium profundum]|uniref:SRPBCC family protein n=1 Tax=Exiguobacterium profundum TaxID=307643 RepID=UPI0035150AD9